MQTDQIPVSIAVVLMQAIIVASLVALAWVKTECLVYPVIVV